MVKSKTSSTSSAGAYFKSLQSKAAKIGFNLDDSLAAYPKEAVDRIFKGAKEIYDEFPGLLSGQVDLIGRDGGRGYGSANFSMDVFFPKKYWGSKDGLSKLDSMKKQDSDTGWHPNNSNTVHHEFGHVIEATLIRKQLGNTGTLSVMEWYDGHEMWRKSKIATQIIGEAARNVKKTPYGKNKRNDDLVLIVSRYAKQGGRSEAFAECIADYMANGSNANPLSIEVAKIAKRRLQS